MSGAYIKVTKLYVEPFGKHFLGTNVNIGAILDDIPSATSATITIDDPAEVVKVDAAVLPQVEDHVYEYAFQTTSTWDEGKYVATISIVNGDYTYISQIQFEMVEQV